MTSSAGIHSRSEAAGYVTETLSSAKVLVVGAGALGQNVILDLALSGIGWLAVVDFDQFERHNITRSPYYPLPKESERFGIFKARVIAHKAVRQMTVADRPARFSYAVKAIQQVGDLAVHWADVVVSAVDTISARAYLAERCRIHAKPMVEAGFHRFQLSLAVFGPDVEEPCFRCITRDREGVFSCRAYATEAERQGVTPAVQNGAAALAALQAEQVVAWIHGEATLRGKRLRLDVRSGQSSITNLTLDAECPGVHAIPARSRVVDVGDERTAVDLLEELDRDFGRVEVTLPEPAVGRAACSVCGHMTDVGAPAWKWQLSPRCTSCGGSFPRSDQGTPLPLSRLDSAKREDLEGLTCRQVGLVPGSLALAETPDASFLVTAVGKNEDVFSLVTQDRETPVLPTVFQSDG